MALLDVIQNYSDGTVLTQAQLNAALESIEEFINVTGLTSENIQSGGIQADSLATNSVTSDKIAAGAVTSNKIGTSAVTAGKIGMAAVTTATIADAAVSGVKLEDTAIESSAILNLSLTATVNANALTIAVKDKAGATPSATTPIKIGFRHLTSATGQFLVRSIIADTSIVVSSGSTLGSFSGNPNWVYVWALDNAGTIELAVSGTKFLDEGSVQSSTAEGGAGAADSKSTLYSTTARSNVPIRLIGRVKSTQATAGTWATAPSEISLVPFSADFGKTVVAKYRTVAGQSIPNNAVTVIDFDTSQYDTAGAVTTGASWKFTAPFDGYYWVLPRIAFVASGSSTAIELTVRKNGVAYASVDGLYGTPGNDAFTGINGTALVPMVAGDYVDAAVYQLSGGNRALVADITLQTIEIAFHAPLI